MEKVVIVVDMVNGFINEGNMADPNINHIVPAIKEELEKCKEGMIFIKDCHEKNSIEFKSYPEHCLKGTSESEVVDELKMYEEKAFRVYEKNSTSAMFADGFMKDMDDLKDLKEVVITGCCTDICILNLALPLKNYFNQENRDVKITVPKACVETYNSDTHNNDEYNEISYKLLSQAGIIVE